MDPEWTAAETRYLAVVAEELSKYLGKGEQINEGAYVENGRAVCGRGEDEDFDGPPTVNVLIENMELNGDVYGAAIKYLCPKYLPVWRKARGGFEEGTYTVGKDIKPGTYRTVDRPVRKCYWERSTGAGRIIDNRWITNAPNGATVTVQRGEGFTSEGCGNWIRAP